MDPTLDKLYAALDQADAAGAEDDALDIAALIREHKAKRTTQPQQQQAAAQPAAAKPNLDMAPAKKPGGDGVDNFMRGLDRLPNLVGLGNVSTGFTKADVSPMEAASRFAQGSSDALYATGRAATSVLGPVDDAVIAGISEMTTNDAETFDQKFARTREQETKLREDQALGSAVGDVIGFGYGGTLLGRANVKLPLGATTRGVGAQSAILAGGNALANDPTDPLGAAIEAGTGAAFGKTLEGIGNAVVKPLAQKYLPKIERAFAGKGAKADAEFQIPENVVQRVATRTKMPVAEVKQNFDDFVAVHGPDDPRFLSLVNAETAGEFRVLAQAKKGAGDTFRATEEAASLARPDVVARGVSRTGATKTAIEATEEAAARGEAAINRTTDMADNAAETFKARTTAQQRAIDDATRQQQQFTADTAQARTRALDVEQATTQRMVRDETDALKIAEKANVDAAAAKLTAAIQQRAAGVKTDEAVKKELARYASLVFRGGKTETGEVVKGLASKAVTLPKGWIRKNFPEDPKTITAVLRAKAETLPKGAARNRLNKAIDSFSAAEDGGAAAMKLTLDDVDSLRRALKKPVDVAGVRYNLTEVGTKLRDYAAKKHPAYQTDYLDVFADTMKALDARMQGALATTGKAVAGADNIAGRVADETSATARLSIKQGAQDAALAAIAQTTKGGTQTLKSAEAVLRNADAIIRLAGREGEELVKTVRETLKNVQRIKNEIAEISSAARTTREGIADDIVMRKQRVADEAKDAIRGSKERAVEIKRGLTDKQAARLKTLERAAKAQLDAIKRAMAKNERAINAASKVLDMTETEFAAATAGSKQPLDQVARGAIAGRASQSPADAIKVVEDLATPSTGRRITQVAGKDTGDALQTLGTAQRREVANLNTVAPRLKEDDVIGEELSLAMEASAALLGRAGPGYQTAIAKRGAGSLKTLGISNNAAKALAQAVVRQDRAYVEKLINRLAKTERQRKVIAEAIRAWVVGSAASGVANVR